MTFYSNLILNCGMIEECFQFLDGIGEKKERLLNKQNVRTWEDFLRARTLSGISLQRKSHYDRLLQLARKALLQQDTGYFSTLQQREMWRLYPSFKNNCCFVDIEADRKGVIVLTIFDRFESTTFVRGVHLEKEIVQKELDKYNLIVTYNGSAFDLLHLKRMGIVITQPHIDLKPLCERLGLAGGLKEIEKTVGIQRPAHLRGSATDAWKAFWASGDREYLELLVAYNEQDAVSLYQLMEWCQKRIKMSKTKSS